MNVIFLSGGSGVRLWPLSNDVKSKQFLKVLKGPDGIRESMLQRMYRMLKDVDSNATLTIATAEQQVDLIKEQLGSGIDMSIEPCRRDTFAAIALSVAYLHDVKHVNADDVVVVCPVDPLVDKQYFEKLNVLYNRAGQANLVLMGIKPTYPSSKYGYIMVDSNGLVKGFKEKPDEITAAEYIKDGALWNAGVFAFKLQYVLNKSKELLGYDSYSDLLEHYEELEKISFDYAVVEHEKDISLEVYDGDWKDLGTWSTLTESIDENILGNAVLDSECSSTNVINELDIPVLGLGLENLVIVATKDGILVSEKEASTTIKNHIKNGNIV